MVKAMQQEFSWEKSVANYRDVYRQILNGRDQSGWCA